MDLEKIIEIYKKYKVEDYRIRGCGLPDVLEIHNEEIDAFCRVLPILFEKEYNVYLSKYLTSLIQLSKSKEISINLPDLPILLESFGYTLRGKKIIINGNLGALSFMYAHNCSVEIRGNVGEWLGHIADSCRFRIVDGNVGANPLENARNCKLELYKNMKIKK